MFNIKKLNTASELSEATHELWFGIHVGALSLQTRSAAQEAVLSMGMFVIS